MTVLLKRDFLMCSTKAYVLLVYVIQSDIYVMMVDIETKH